MPTPKPQALIYSAWKSSCISPCQHGGIFHAVVEHLPPQSAWRPLVASPLIPVRLWLLVPLPRSLGLPSPPSGAPLSRLPAPLGGGCSEGAWAPCSGVAPPVGLPAPLPSHAPLIDGASQPALSATRSVNVCLFEHYRIPFCEIFLVSFLSNSRPCFRIND